MKPTDRMVLTIFVGLVFLCGIGLGCKGKESQDKPQEASTSGSSSLEKKIAMPDARQMPPGMGQQFPPEMMKAMEQSGQAAPGSGMMAKGPMPSTPMKASNKPVVVTPEVKSKWKAVVIQVVNKETRDQNDYVVEIEKSFAIPGTKIKIDVLHFLPDFLMSKEGITSRTNEPNNPAVKVAVHEDSEKLFENWLFKKMPTVHPFKHKVYAITLKGQQS